MSNEPKEPSQWADVLKAECNRYVNGQCSGLACLMRGGYAREQQEVDYGIATCAFHEALQACADRDAEIEKLNSALQAALVIEQDTVISKDAEIARLKEKLLWVGWNPSDDAEMESGQEKITKLKTALQDADRINNDLCGMIAQKEQRIAELEQSCRTGAARSLQMSALLDRAPHEYFSGNCPSCANCIRCAYEKIRHETKTQA